MEFVFVASVATFRSCYEVHRSFIMVRVLVPPISEKRYLYDTFLNWLWLSKE